MMLIMIFCGTTKVVMKSHFLKRMFIINTSRPVVCPLGLNEACFEIHVCDVTQHTSTYSGDVNMFYDVTKHVYMCQSIQTVSQFSYCV